MTSSRIAPTPSGYLHIGNIYSFVITWLLVRKEQGSLSLRIDDLDQQRARKAYIDDIFETLSFMGIDYDTGPAGPNEFFERYSQQLRINFYNQLIDQLIETGLVYACTCSRKTIHLRSQGRIYNGACLNKKLPLDTLGACLRIHVPSATVINFQDELIGNQQINLSRAMGDFVIKRKEGTPAYQVASLADDEFYGINYIVRGQDLVYSTAAQLYLAGLAGNRNFLESRFYHHQVINGESGAKLSKSSGSQSIKTLRSWGLQPADILQIISKSLPVTPFQTNDYNIYDLLKGINTRQFS